MKPKKRSLIPTDRIERSILLIRGQKVMLDVDLAWLYGVETKNLVKAVKRNIDRFPSDFMFQLKKEEFDNLRFHFGTSRQWGGRRYLPYAFTEQGVAMLSSVLRSSRILHVSEFTFHDSRFTFHASRSTQYEEKAELSSRQSASSWRRLSHPAAG